MLRKCIYLSVCFFLATFSSSIYGQTFENKEAEKKVSESKIIRIDEHNKGIKYIQLKPDYFNDAKDQQTWLNKSLKFTKNHQVKILHKETDKKGFIHSKYQIYFKNIPIEGGVYTVHSINGRIHSANGEYIQGQDISVTSVLKEQDAFDKAVKYVNAISYKWESVSGSRPIGELIILPVDSLYILAYKFDIYASEPLSRQYIFVNANNGEIIKTLNRIHIINAIGTAKTMYNGNVSITTDSYNGSYRLRERGRGNGIETYNLNHSSSYSSATDFIDADNNWTDTIDYNHAANDAHFATEATYDYYFTKFGRNSYDNNGAKIMSYVHYGHNYVNAFWDGSSMTYGDGDGVNYLPLTPIEVVGHEITHGVTEHSAGLIYSGESGALNESFSDIFGTVIDFFKNPTKANYLMGDAMSVTHTPFRSMQNPNDYYDPGTYKGLYWDYSEEVHTNSGVQNHWFYLLSEGGIGTNELGSNYNVIAIGRDKVAQIAYRSLTVYLTPSSNYADARFYSIQSAIDLFGDCSPEVIAVSNAWYAVGVGLEYNNIVSADFISSKIYACNVPAKICFYNRSSKSTSYSWNFGDGTSDTTRNPIHTYNSAGSYLIRLIANGNTLCNNSDTARKTLNVTQSLSITPANCTPHTLNTGLGGIFSFQFNTINKIANGSIDDYQDYSCSDTTYVTEGRKYKIAVKVGNSNLENVNVWADLNNNGRFDDSGELIYQRKNVSKNFSDSIIFPGGASKNVPLRLRVGSDFATSPLINACTNTNYGQYQDYALFVRPNTLKPSIVFTSDKKNIISGDTVQFKDNSLNLPTLWNWSFPGGTPSSSTTRNPRIAYSTPGIYNVTLTASNTNGSNSITKTGYIKVTTPAPVGLTSNITNQADGVVKLKWYTSNDNNVYEDFDGTADNFIFSDTCFKIENGNLKARGYGDYAWKSACYEREFQDFSLEYKMQMTQGQFSVGTFIRAQGFMNDLDANGYLINVLPSGSYSAWKLINGNVTNIIPWNSTTAINTAMGAWNIVTIEAIGSNIKIYVNSQYVDEFNDNTFSSGKINLDCYAGVGVSYDYSWDYLHITTALAPFNNSIIQKATNTILSGEANCMKPPIIKIQNNAIEAKSLMPQTNSIQGSNVFNNYKIYRDSVLLKSTVNTSYQDTLPKYGNYKYFVKALYEEGESNPSNTTNVKWLEINPGENCLNAQNLSSLTSPYSGTTIGYNGDFTFCSLGSSPDRIFYIDVPTGNTLNIGVSSDNFDSRHSIRIGGSCPGNTELYCVDDPDNQIHTYINTTGSVQRVYYILGGYSSTSSGTFTLTWKLTPPIKPVVNFAASNTSIQVGDNVYFTDFSSGIPTSYKWYFSGGTPAYSTLANPTVTYSVAGTYDVKLFASNSIGADSMVKVNYIQVQLPPKPIVSFNSSSTLISTGSYINFYDYSYNYPTSRKWTFAGGTPSSSTQSIAKVVYTTPGIYDVKLVVLNAGGSDSIIQKGYITVIPTVRPVANFISNITTCIASSYVSFSDNSGNNPTSFKWTFVGGSPSVSTSNYANVFYNTPGIYNVKLVVANSNGADSIMKTGYITVTLPPKPIANFSSDVTSVISGSNIYFSDLSASNPSFWKWSFPGGTPSTSTYQTQSVIYNTIGTYDVKLVVLNSGGSDSITKPSVINVVTSLPGDNCSNAQDLSLLTSPYSSSTTGYKSDFTLCSFNSTPDRIFYIDVPNGSTLNIGQTFNDFDSRHSLRVGGSCPGTTELYCVDDPDYQNQIYTNTSGAIQRVYYILCGYSSVSYGNFTLSWQISSNGRPIANFAADYQKIQPGYNVNFTNLSSGNSNSFKWTFQGGTPSNSTYTNPSVYYELPGIYNVKLVTTNSYGVDSLIKQGYISVSAPAKPVASFNSDRTLVTSGSSVYFYNNSTNSPTSWKWTFTGGSPSNSVDYYPNVVYNSPGLYSVKLVVTNAGGSDSIVKNQYITVISIPKPVANFNTNNNTVIIGDYANIIDNSGNNPTFWKWTFTGGSPSTSTYNYPSVRYDQPGVYDVKLVASNAGGSDSITKIGYITVTMPPKPLANFYSNTTNTTLGSTVYFYDYSTNAPNTWKWTFSGGTPSTSILQNPYITYNSYGDYNVSLKVTNAGGADSIVKTGYIRVSKYNYCSYYLGGGGYCPGDINLVAITGTTLNNSVHDKCSTSNYSTYAFYPSSGNTTTTLMPGNTYELGVTTSNADIISVWIDYNQNGIFETSEWKQVTLSSSPGAISKVNFTIPQTAITGETAIRIRSCSYGSTNGSSDACSYFYSGITEDYTISIVNNTIEFNADTTSICKNDVVKFTKTGTKQVNTYAWDFGDGASPRTGNTVGPHHVVYTTSGPKTVSLVADGIVTTKTNYINVFNLPSTFPKYAPSSYCAGSSVSITLLGSETGTLYDLYLNNTGLNRSIAGTGSSLIWTNRTAGTYKVFGINNNRCGINVTDTFKITEIPIPNTPEIYQNQNKLYSKTETGNQWYSLEKGLLSGAMNNVYEPLQNGSYFSIVTKNGCNSSVSNAINFIINGIDELKINESIAFFPNPFNDILNIRVDNKIVITKIEIRNILGNIVQNVIPETQTNFLYKIDMSGKAEGLYTITLYTNIGILTYKVLKLN